jgi:hypothetical protein
MIYVRSGSDIRLSPGAEGNAPVGPSPEIQKGGGLAIWHAQSSAKFLPFVTYLVFARFLLNDNELEFVEPRGTLTLKHVLMNNVAFGIKQFGDCGDVEILPAIIDYLEIFSGEEFAADSMFHDIDIVVSFRRNHSRVVHFDRGSNFSEEASQGSEPAAFKVRQRNSRILKDWFGDSRLPLAPRHSDS